MAKFGLQLKESLSFLCFCGRVKCCSAGTKQEHEKVEEPTIKSVQDAELKVEARALRGPKRPGLPRGGGPQTT